MVLKGCGTASFFKYKAFRTAYALQRNTFSDLDFLKSLFPFSQSLAFLRKFHGAAITQKIQIAADLESALSNSVW